MSESQGHILGIDLGTTFSAMAYLDRHGQAVTIPNSEGELTTPSVVLFETGGNVVVGREARRACVVQPSRVAACVKRDMGEKYFIHPVAGKRLAPQAIAAFILKKLKQDAERRIGPVAGAVITVPAYFDEARRQATIEAGSIAGLSVVDIINEPTSAALAYAFREYVRLGGSAADMTGAPIATTAPTTAMVCDLGGGTFDVTIIRIEGKTVRVLATDGDVRLGGKDWDDRLVDYAADLFLQQYASDPRADLQSLQDLLLTCEEAKKDLSRRQGTQFVVNHAGQRLAVQVTREQFEEMTSDLLYRVENRVDRVIRQGRLRWRDIDEVLMVGGASRMPQVSAMLKAVTNREPNASLSADEVVAHGAAIHGAVLVLASPDRTWAGVKVAFDREEEASSGGPGQAPAPAAAPARKEGVDRHALAAFDGDISDVLRNVTTVNVNSHSLGVVASSPRRRRNVTSVLIPRNSALPASAGKTYGTEQDNQKVVRIQVVEGESSDPSACVPIGECVISQLPGDLPKNSPISVTFTYDDSGLLHVQAKDDTTGRTARTVIHRPSAMSQAQIDLATKIVSRTAVS